MRKPSQSDSILNHLFEGKSITPLEALHKFDCLRLSGRIFELRKDYNIKMEMISLKSGKRVAQYSYDYGS